MSYLSAKKIYPGNQTSALNGWYKNIDTTENGTNDSSLGGPTSVLAIPGYRYFQQRGYVEVGSGVLRLACRNCEFEDETLGIASPLFRSNGCSLKEG